MNEKNRLLFVDDEKYFAQGYLDELDNHFRVTVCRAADQAEAEIISAVGSNVYVAAVVDVMMPVPESWPETDRRDCRDGVMTGVILLRRNRERVTSAKLPIVVLTNRMRREVDDELKKMGFADAVINVRHKLETPAFMLPTLVRSLIE